MTSRPNNGHNPRGPRTPADLRVRCPGCGGIKPRAHVERCTSSQPTSDVALAIARRLAAAGFPVPEGMSL